MNDAYRYISQECNEQRYSRKFIDGYIRQEIEASDELQAKIDHGVDLINEYMAGEYYDSKMARIEQLKDLNIRELVFEIFVGVAYCLREELFTSITAQMSSRLEFSDKTEAITTVAEMMAVLCETDAYDINKPTKFGSLVIESRIPLSEKLISFIQDSQYLPPMVCEPKKLVNNQTSGYLTHNDSLILGNGNHHDGDICLDVLNTMNRVELQLDTQFLSKVEEDPTFEFETQEQYEQWMVFKRQSYRFYDLMVAHGNRLHLTHKVDKRGRIYAQGYHITTQGSAFKKASIELAHEELIEGVPT